MTKLKRIVSLSCCCCGQGLRGRQWWNRDTGYGICTKCIDWQRSRGLDAEEERLSYGDEGVHYNIKEA